MAHDQEQAPDGLSVGQHVTDCMREYVEYTSEERALPSVIDGCKPVQRRLLYGAGVLLGLKPSSKTVKSARVVGETMGRLHPHGDSGIYGGLVTVCAKTNARNPLFDDEQGNWGDNQFGDSAAAHRYTETVITGLGYEFIKDVAYFDMVPNYDGEEMEPFVLCPPFPAALLNHNEGIAAGISTKLPAHNIGNICDAATAYVKSPNCRDQTLLDAIVAPDPTHGGIILDYDENREGLRNLYLHGYGKLWYGVDWEIKPSDDNDWKKMLVIKSLVPGLGGLKLTEAGLPGGMFHHLIEAGEIDVLDDSEGSLRIQYKIYFNNSAVIVNGVLPQLRDYSETYTMNVIDYAEEGGVLVEKEIAQVGLRYIISRWHWYRREIIGRRLAAKIEELNWDMEKLLVQKYLATHPKEREQMFKCEDDEQLYALLSGTMGFNDRQCEYAPRLQVRSIMRLSLEALEAAIAKVEADLEQNHAWANDIDSVILEELKDIKKRFGDERRVKLFEEPPLPKVTHQTYLLAAGSEGTLMGHTDWPAQGKGMGNCIAATFTDKTSHVINYNGKVVSKLPFEFVTGYSDYAYGVASDAAKYIVAVDTNGDLYVRTVPEGGWAKSTKLTKSDMIAGVGVAEGQGVLVRMHTEQGEGTGFHYVSPANIAALARDNLKPSYSLWWDENTNPCGLIVAGPNSEVVGTNGRPIDIDWEDYESIHRQGEVKVVDVKNLVTYKSGRAAVLSTAEVYKTLDTVASCIPLFGSFSEQDD